MSKKPNTKAIPAVEAQAKENDTQTKKETKQQEKAQPRVYCGPSVRGVARQYTVFTKDIPEALTEFIKEHPAASALIVPTDCFSEMRRKLETVGTPEAILYKQIKSEL